MNSNLEDLKKLVAQNLPLLAVLSSNEVNWKDRQGFLQSKGYMLRPRYHPDWVPSWTLPENAGIDPFACEDSIALPPTPSVVDAIRVSDDRMVFIKRVRTQGQELRIASLLSSPILADDPRNHSVPLLDAFEDDAEPTLSYIVMPSLLHVNNPAFESVNDIVDFVDQIVEGLVFMHEQGVAHRDCAYMNIMMDASTFYAESFHPVMKTFDRSLRRRVYPLPRGRVFGPVRYFFTDFGISAYFPAGKERGLVTGIFGLDQDVPELSREIPYDPFKVDVFIIGNMFRTLLFNEYSNLAFLEPLIQVMTVPDANERATAAQAQQIWQDIRFRINTLSRMWRLHSRKELWPVSLLLDGVALVGRGASAGMSVLDWLNDMQG